MPRVIVCDVNETLLNLDALGPYFEETFGDRRVLHEWFQTVLLYSEVVTIAGPVSEFRADRGGGAGDDRTRTRHQADGSDREGLFNDRMRQDATLTWPRPPAFRLSPAFPMRTERRQLLGMSRREAYFVSRIDPELREDRCDQARPDDPDPHATPQPACRSSLSHP